jgi:class 3 adenylate cyclase
MSASTSTELLELALQAEHLGHFDEARERLRRIVLLGETPQGLTTRLKLGALLIAGGPPLYDEAESVLAAARVLAENEGAPRQEAAAIHLLALLERQRGRLDGAERLLRESPSADQVADPSPERAQWLHYHGLIEADRGHLNTAERFLFRAHQVYLESHHEPGLAEVCDSLANMLLRRGKARVAQTFARMSLERKRKLGDRFGEAISLGTLGRAYRLEGRYDEAADAFAQDLGIARELGDTRGIGIMLNSLGEVALRRKDLDAAGRFYREAMTIEAGSVHAALSQLGMAWVNLAENRPGEAVAACDRAEEQLDGLDAQHPLRHALSGLRGAVAARRGDAEGERLLNDAVEALVGSNHTLDTIPLLYELRDHYQRLGQRDRAVGVMTRALDLLGASESEQGVQDVENWLRTVDAPGLTRLALEQHFPPWLIGDVLSGRMRRTRATRQPIAVLFSDVRDYTTMTEGLGPELVVEILNEWFAEATRVIRRHGGWIDKFIGDAVMALFGVPEPRDDAAASAVSAALELRDALAAINMRQKALGKREIRVGIGVDSGDAVVGFVGSHLRQSYTAIGDTVNTAARLESATRDQNCEILISAAVEEVQRRHGVAESRFVGALELKGKGQGVPTYEVLGPQVPAVRS